MTVVAPVPASLRTDTAWNDLFERLVLLVATEGVLPESGASPEQTALAQWLRQQRRAYRAHRMSSGRWDRLRSAPEPIAELFQPIDPLGDEWCTKVELLVLFVNDHGRMPKSTIKEELGLYSFVSQQLKNKRQGSLSAQRAQVLRSLPDPIGAKFQPARDSWETRAAELIGFAAKHDRLPANSVAEESSLAQWMYRQTLRRRSGSLSEARAQQLSTGHKDLAVLFSTGNPSEAKWDRSLAMINSHATETGKIPSRSAHDPQEQRMWRWMVTQLTAHRNGKLSERRLESLRAAHPVIAARFPGV